MLNANVDVRILLTASEIFASITTASNITVKFFIF